MSRMALYLHEQILIGCALHFGRDGVLPVLPQLKPDRFVYGMNNGLGEKDNARIWKAICYLVLEESAEPFIGQVLPLLGESVDMAAYLISLETRVVSEWRIPAPDTESLRHHARVVHHVGTVHHMVRHAQTLSAYTDAEAFERFVRKIPDAEQWAAGLLEQMQREVAGDGTEGYQPIGKLVEKVRVKWDAMKSGEQLVLLPVGLPVLYGHGLFPVDSLALLHGLSSGGKSTLVHNVINLGTALGLMKAGRKGCVAINSLEMSYEQFVGRAAASLAGFNMFTLTTSPSKVSDADYARFLDYAAFVGKLPILVDDTPSLSADTLRLRSTGLHLSEHGPIHQLSTDYLELFDTKTNVASEKTRERELAVLTHAHYQIKRALGCSVIAISQSTYQNKTWVAGLYGARYSRALTHGPDIVVELVNYPALKRAGEDYVVANGLDEHHVWLLVQKYRGGPADHKIALNWTPEYTRIWDPGLTGLSGEPVLFEHLEEVRRLLGKHPTTQVVPIQDTPLWDMGGQQDDILI